MTAFLRLLFQSLGGVQSRHFLRRRVRRHGGLAEMCSFTVGCVSFSVCGALGDVDVESKECQHRLFAWEDKMAWEKLGP
ncbi:unnamed protein product [Dibothriocephalus latus]|uniref:Uncharacterized protein n=1 Tax=Dibothriocephalus latus TaxID=60516 RepID=A0A3P7NND1_DIBLA|nr:unnamed protein product [Dibothriocephalus latus]